MAGIFGFFDPTRPGKGVDVEAPPKKPFFRFWELYWRKFSRFIILNLISFAFFFPMIAVVFRFFNIWLFSFQPELLTVLPEEGTVIFSVFQDILLSLPISWPFAAPETFPQVIFLLFLIASVVFYGPVMCGMSFMMRNFAREEHAWLSDFFLRMKANFKQGVIMGLLELFAVSMLFLNITMQFDESAGGWASTSLSVAKLVSPFLLLLILFIRNYMYTMAVTFDQPLLVIFRNSLAFAFIGLVRNFLALGVSAVLVLAVFFLPMCDILLVPFFFFSFSGFLTVFACYPLIHKHMLLPALKRKQAAEEGAEECAEGSE